VQQQESHRPGSAARVYARPGRDGKARQISVAESSPVLAMLAARGIPPGQIAAIAAGAEAQGSTAADYLVGNGYVTSDTLYRCIAQHTGVAFLDGKLPLRGGFDPHAASRLGTAPLEPDLAAGARILFAPRDVALDQLISDLRSTHNLQGELALTTPDRLDHALRVHAADEIAAAAADALSDFDPSLSARKPPAVQEIAIASMCLVGLVVLGVSLPVFASTCAALLFFAAIVLRLFALAESLQPSASAPSLRDAELPIYTIIVALYREQAVIDHLLDALDAIDYPRAKLDTKIVVEADDFPTIQALRAARTRFPFEIVVAPPGRPRTKPRALNIALPFARGALTCVFDAEDVPSSTQLRQAAEVFANAAPDLACLQARLVIDNHTDSWLTRLYAIDYATLFEVVDPGFANLKLPVPLGGSSNHFRTEALHAVGGWDAWNVTEDADLGLRVARFGYEVATFDAETLEEAPAALPAFLRQRTRWLKGWMRLRAKLRSSRPFNCLALQAG
jgi:hypothetical protein